MDSGALKMVFIWEEEDSEEGCFSHKPGFDVGGKAVNRERCWQSAEEKTVDEADRGDAVKEEDAAAYEDVFCDGCSDHCNSMKLCLCSIELLIKSA